MAIDVTNVDMDSNEMDKKLLSKILTPRINRWKVLNENGRRIEAKMEIARYFALNIDGRPFEGVYKELQGAQKLGVYIISTELFIDNIMLFKLRYEWGDEVYNLMKECI